MSGRASSQFDAGNGEESEQGRKGSGGVEICEVKGVVKDKYVGGERPMM